MMLKIDDMASKDISQLDVETTSTTSARSKLVMTPTTAVRFRAFTVVNQLKAPLAKKQLQFMALMKAFHRSNSTPSSSVGGLRVNFIDEFSARLATFT